LIYRELEIPAPPAHGGEDRIRLERRTRLALWAIALGSLAIDWRLLVFGYLLPLAVVTPLFNTVRIVLEHFDVGRGNPLWPATFYRTGWITRPAFLWSAGDCHVVHHFYPNIPYYRMPQALRLISPILRREGVYEHKALLPLMAEWFAATRGHWSEPARAAAAEVVSS
jgi:fatty acid desaturase